MASVNKVIRTARDLLAALDKLPLDHRTAVLAAALRQAVIEHDRP